MPYAEVLLAHLALPTRGLIMAGRVVGRGWVVVRMHVVDKGRARPLAWQDRQGKQGHLPADRPIALVQQGSPRIPLGAAVGWLGDGECAGTTLQHTWQAAPWAYGVRTGRHITVRWDGERCRCATVAAWSKPETWGALPAVRVTAAASGPVRLRCGWAQGDKEPLPLLPHLAAADEAGRV